MVSWMVHAKADPQTAAYYQQRTPQIGATFARILLMQWRQKLAHLVLQLKLLGQRPARNSPVVVGALVLVQLVHKEAVEEVALGAQPRLPPLCVPVLHTCQPIISSSHTLSECHQPSTEAYSEWPPNAQKLCGSAPRGQVVQLCTKSMPM